MTAVTQHPSTTSAELGQSSIGVLGAIKDVQTLKSKKLIKLGSFNTHTEAGSEISAYDATEKKLFITNGATNKVDVVSMSDVQAPELLTSIDLATYGASVQSVAVKNGKLAIAVGSANKVTTKGRVVVLSTSDYAEILDVEVGYLPDMVTFNEDGTKIVVANEGEPIATAIGDYVSDANMTVTTVGTDGDYVDVAGSIGIVTVADGSYVDINFSTATLDAALDATPVRLGGTPSNDQTLDIEPEYITVKGNFAYVTLQENNAVAKVDLTNNTLEFVRSLGAKDYESENRIDIEEDGIISLKNYKGLKSLYMPDSISSYSFGGATYLVTANEGDGREYPVSDVSGGPDTGDVLTDEKKISKLTLDASIADYYADDNDLKVLTDVSTSTTLYTLGGRSFSIWDTNGNLVWDSGDAISRAVATYEPKLFNQDDGAMDGRSGNKGAEPEALSVGTIDGKTYAFVGLERQSAIVIYDITNPYETTFVDYVVTHEQNDVSPEGMVFIPAASSPNGKNLLVVSYEMSGSTVVYEIK
jgi:5'-nucleotidase